MSLADIQSQPDNRNMPIDQVGVKGIKYPVIVLEREKGKQHTVGNINMFVELPHNFRGTHMSRFIEILNLHMNGISTAGIKKILSDMKEKLDAEKAYFEIEFPFFIRKAAPVSGSTGKMEYMCKIFGDSSADYYMVEVRVPVLSLCPCSKEISSYGAHNQRSIITIKIKASEIIWIEDIILIAESSASSDIYSILKREDEKFITEKSYDNPMFVEDMVRSAAEKLSAMEHILAFSVESENMESIHNHSAYASISRNM